MVAPPPPSRQGMGLTSQLPELPWCHQLQLQYMQPPTQDQQQQEWSLVVVLLLDRGQS